MTELSDIIDAMDASASELEGAVEELKSIGEIIPAAEFVRDTILPAMDKLRASADKAETVTADDRWPFPTYDKLLFGV